MPHVSIAPSTTQPTMPNGRKRGCESAMTMKTVARIQYIGTSITDAAFFAHGSLQTTRSETMPNNPRNEGEGNKSADRNYREATQKFVESERGREQIEKAGDVDADARSDMH